MKKYNVVFTLDEIYLQHFSVALISLLENNKNIKLNIFIFINYISSVNEKKIKSIINGYNATLKIILINESVISKLVCKHHFKYANYYRLLIPELISESKALYLDSDIVVNGSIKEMYEINIDNHFIAAVINPNVFKNKELKMNDKSKYFNSGVMVINVDKWREEQLTERVISFVDRHRDLVQFPDQDGLNAIIDGCWISLHAKFNLQHSFVKDNFLQENEQFASHEIIDAINEPVIVHFTGPLKPWHLRDTHPYKKLYWKYLKKSPYSRLTPNDLSCINILKYLVPRKVIPLLKRVLR